MRFNEKTGTGRAKRGYQIGQTMVELLIASMVILVAITGLLLVFTQALATTVTSKEHQAANSIAVRAMEKVRAMPFATVAVGLNNSTSTASVFDPVTSTTVTVSGTSARTADPTNITTAWKTTFLPSTAQEDIPNANLVGSGRIPNRDPLFPHIQTKLVNKTTYTTRAFVSKKFDDPNVLRVTLMVSWPDPKKAGGIKTITTQSFVYSPNGCVSSATHPFAAPCQPFFYSTTTTGIGSVHLTPGDPDTTGISGMRDTDFERAQIDLTEAFTTMQVEQITALTGKARAGGAKLDAPAQPKQNGNTVVNGRADDDPGSTPDLTLNDAFTSQTESTTQLDLGPDDGATTARRIFADTSALDSGELDLAIPGLNCHEGDAVTLVNTSLPCAHANVKQTGTTSIFFRLRESGSHDHQGFVTTMGTAPVPSVTTSGRYASSGIGTFCSTTSGEGCVHGYAKRALGNLRLGRLVSGFTTPTGWNATTAYVSLENYGDVTNSEAGIAAAAPTAARIPANGVGTYAIKYYDGSAVAAPGSPAGNYYTTLDNTNWPATPIDIAVPPLDLINSSGSGTWHLEVSADLTTGGIPTTSSSGPALCAEICTRRGQVTSPITGDIYYRIWEETPSGPKYWVDMKIGVDLGTNVSETQYRKAPSAG